MKIITMHPSKTLVLCMGLLLSSLSIRAQESTSRSVNLSDLFELADQNNRLLHILSNEQASAEEAIQGEKNKLLPSIDASLRVSYNGDGYITDRNFSNGFSIPIPDFGNNFVLEAKQLIYAGGVVNTSIEAARANAEIKKLETEEARQNIRFAITGYYLELLKLKNQRPILEKNIEQTQKLIEQMKGKNTEGLALKNNVTRYELQLQGLQLALLKLDNSVKITNNELVKLLQLPKGTKLDVKTESTEAKSSLSSANWMVSAQESSSTLKKSSLSIEQALRGQKMVQSSRMPQIYAFAGNYFNGPVMIEIPVLNNNFNYWNVGVGVQYSLSSLYKNPAKERQAKLSVSSAQEGDLLVKEQLNNEIEAAQIRYEESLQVYETHVKGVELAAQNYAVIRNRFVNDMALTTEMLDAENTKLDAELQAANSQINILFQYYQLKKLTGTL